MQADSRTRAMRSFAVPALAGTLLAITGCFDPGGPCLTAADTATDGQAADVAIKQPLEPPIEEPIRPVDSAVASPMRVERACAFALTDIETLLELIAPTDAR